MSGIEKRIEEAIIAHERADWGQHDGWWECTCGQPRTPAHVAAAIAAGLGSWDVLMSILDEHYPESVFPTTEDHEDRDTGPRIVSLVRHLDHLRSLQRDDRANAIAAIEERDNAVAEVERLRMAEVERKR